MAKLFATIEEHSKQLDMQDKDIAEHKKSFGDIVARVEKIEDFSSTVQKRLDVADQAKSLKLA